MVEIEEIKAEQHQRGGPLKYTDVHKVDKDGKDEGGAGGIGDIY